MRVRGVNGRRGRRWEERGGDAVGGGSKRWVGEYGGGTCHIL